MQLGMIGMERMGASMAQRLMKAGHVCVELLSAMRHAFGGHVEKPAEDAR